MATTVNVKLTVAQLDAIRKLVADRKNEWQEEWANPATTPARRNEINRLAFGIEDIERVFS